MIPSMAAFDFRWITDHLGVIIFAFFFFVVPILNGLKKSAEQKRASERRSPKAPDEVQREERSAREAWEDLLRGNAPSPAPPPMPPAAPPIQRVEPLEQEIEAKPLVETFSGLEPAASEDEEEASYDEEKLARAENEAGLREEMQRRAEFQSRVKEPAARKSIAAADMAESDYDADARAAVASLAARRRDLLGLGGDRRAALRRSLVAGEVFGRPLALRRPFEADHP